MSTSNLPLVLLTSRMDATGEAILSPHVRMIVAPDNSATTLNMLARDAHGIIVRNPLPTDILDHAPHLLGIARHGTGLDMVPVSAATARGIPVSYVPGANSAAVAEYCFAAMLSLRRQLAASNASLRAANWAAARALSAGALELNRKTLGIVGFGQIGHRVATIGGMGFGMRVLTTTRRPGNLPNGILPVPIEELFELSDAIILCCPLTNETRGLVGASLLHRVKPTAILVNVARGAIIDDDALACALREGRLGGAAVDVFTAQPPPGNHPFFDLPNLIMTPHLAGLTRESMIEMSIWSATDMLCMLRGERPTYLANPEVYS